MKILHLPVAYLPWITGGREVYCHSLCRALAPHGIECVVAIHQNPHVGEPLGWHEHEGIPVAVLPPLPELNSRKSFYTREFQELPGFEALLADVQPDLVHFHDQSGGASLSHLKRVKALGLPAVVTYHSPGQTCLQSALLREGRIPCDGKVDASRCTSCRLMATGMPRIASHILAAIEWPGINPWSESRVARVLSARTMTRTFQDSLHAFMRLSDAIVVLAAWSRDVWLLNQCPPEKLRLVRTGRPRAADAMPTAPRYPQRPTLRIGCIGRCDPIKGFNFLIDAIKSLPDLPLEVHFLGPYWDQAYGDELKRKISSDRRFLPPRLVPNAELVAVLADLDVVVIPSIWPETGPLVLFEAYAAGVPVVASRLGGPAELVRDGVDGRLFAPGDAMALAKIIAEFSSHPASLENLRKGIRQEGARFRRTFDEVAKEMASIYSELLKQPTAIEGGTLPLPA
ncbi:MAG TPA: glycosyltransferase [Opitutaceae bacterium]|jgi:glycosyltransferase involved in cell wall biosynthesis|nr:glycosyltransferase [Opitutaceae bacterium]